jgi:hypothetical protein
MCAGLSLANSNFKLPLATEIPRDNSSSVPKRSLIFRLAGLPDQYKDQCRRKRCAVRGRGYLSQLGGIYFARMIDAPTEISDACRGPFFGEMKEKAIHGWSFW